MSALNNLGKKMLGYADEFIEGGVKGLKKNINVNSLKSNMTKGQLKNIKLKNGAEAAARTVAKKTGQSVDDVSKAMAKGASVKIGRGNINLSNKKNIVSRGMEPTFMNKMGDAALGGYREGYKGAQAALKSGAGVKDAVKQGLNAGFKNADGTLNTGRVAGAVVTAGVVGRVATGGGLYKDRYGNTNLIGVPFI